jgi:hypothetical protein
MTKIGVVLTSVALAVVMLFFGYVGPTNSMRKAKALTAPAKPNIVFILTDDMRKDDLKYMPKTKALLQSAGMTFENAFVSNALCCPSRSTIMRGQYSHNNGVWSNSSTDSSSTISGGWQAYQQNANEADNVAAPARGWIQDRALRQVPKRLRQHVREAHWVGQMVRSLQLGRPPLLRLQSQRPGHHYPLRHQRFRLFHGRDKQAGRLVYKQQHLPAHTVLRLRGAHRPPRSFHPAPARRARLRRHQRPAI